MFVLPVCQCHAFKQARESWVDAQSSRTQWTETVCLAVRFSNSVIIIVIIIKSCASPPDWVAVRRGNHEMPAVDHLSPPDWSESHSGVHTGQVIIRIRIRLRIRSDLVGFCSFWVLCLCHSVILCCHAVQIKSSSLRKTPSEWVRKRVHAQPHCNLVCNRSKIKRDRVIKTHWLKRRIELSQTLRARTVV